MLFPSSQIAMLQRQNHRATLDNRSKVLKDSMPLRTDTMLRSVGSHDCKALLSPVRWSGVDTCQLQGSPETHAAVPAANVIVELDQQFAANMLRQTYIMYA